MTKNILAAVLLAVTTFTGSVAATSMAVAESKITNDVAELCPKGIFGGVDYLGNNISELDLVVPGAGQINVRIRTLDEYPEHLDITQQVPEIVSIDGYNVFGSEIVKNYQNKNSYYLELHNSVTPCLFQFNVERN